MHAILAFLRYLGVLRALLLLVTLMVIACAPFADGRVQAGWMLGPSVIAPTLMAMLAFSLPLDITMTRVFMLDRPAPERRRYRRILWLETALLLVMLAAWAPFILRIMGR
ncbi:MAG: hypothetical protein NFCOHLIN_00412 [Gammaproteobacteria bacterium]|nr:hypothetical protein [Gammaproteobacteria bacterium]